MLFHCVVSWGRVALACVLCLLIALSLLVASVALAEPFPGCVFPNGCNSSSFPYDERPNPASPLGSVGAGSGYRPKDFALCGRDSAETLTYHVFYIITPQFTTQLDTTERRLGHARSSDLKSWVQLAPKLVVSDSTWDNLHVWAPSIVADSDSFYMFYTGVDSSGTTWRRQRIGLAVSPDLLTWERQGPIFSCNNAPWTWCDSTVANGRDFRDPFVMPDPYNSGHWLMYYAARMPEGNMVPGLARSDGDLRTWEDAGPLWTWGTGKFWNEHPKLESPHVFPHVFASGDTSWYLIFTSNSGQALEGLTSSSPTDSGSAWGNHFRIANLDCVDTGPMQGSEYFRDTLGAGLEYFGNYAPFSIDIRPMHWQSGDRFSFDFERPAPISDVSIQLGRTTATIEWTTPGDDSLDYVPCRARLAYSTSNITEANFFSCDTLPTNASDTSGTVECVEADYGTLSSCTTYYFAIKTQDDVHHWSALSNVPSGKTACSGYTEVLCEGEGLRAQGGGESGWAIDNTILNLAWAGSSTTDLYAMKGAPSAVRLSRNGGGSLALDQARLAVVDHSSDVEAFADDGHVLLGETSAVVSVLDDAGDTLTTSLAASAVHRIEAEDTLHVTLAQESSPDNALLLELAGGTTLSDADTGGVEVQVSDGEGGWELVERIHPRRYFAPSIVDSLDGTELRLVFHEDYELRRVERIAPSSIVSLSPVGPDSASHSASGTVTSALASVGGTTTSLTDGDAVVLHYTLPELKNGLVRNVFLLATGELSSGTSPSVAREALPDTRPVESSFALWQKQPNPFKGSTRIRFDLPAPRWVRLEVFDLQGRRVTMLADRLFAGGSHTVEWDHRSVQSEAVRPGVYIYRIRAGEFRDSKKLVLLP